MAERIHKASPGGRANGAWRKLAGLAFLVLGAAALIAPSTAAAQGQAGTTLTANKTAEVDYVTTYDWDIDKYTDPADDENGLLLNKDQVYAVTYKVTVTPSNGTDSATVSGEVCVTNGGDRATEGLAISDELKNGVPPPNDVIQTQNVDVSSNPVLDPGESHCYPYEFVLTGEQIHPGGTYKNTANVTITNHSGHLGEPFGPSPSADAVMPNAPTAECVDVNDTYTGAGTDGYLGEVCGDGGEVTFTYTRDVPTDECGEFTLDNTASFQSDQREDVNGEDSVSIPVTVTGCNGDSCTLTPGYWKTHSEHGPAKKDDPGWAAVGGPDTMFYSSGKSWYEVLWTSPNGNAYYILAHAYIAAKLNVENGADDTDAAAALAAAETLFGTHTPEYVAGLKGKNGNALRAEFINLAKTLDDYNNGLTGPGHCSENSNSA